MEKLILESVVRSTLIAIGTAVALYVLGVKAARVRHAIWAGVVALMLILPSWTAWGPKAVLRVLTPPPVVDAQPVVVHQALDQDGPALPVRSSVSTVWTLQSSLLALYLLGFGALMARLIVGTVRTRMLVRRAGNRAGRLTSDACVTPITVGWLRPSVILPSNWTRWSRAQLNAVLAHEDEHARRRDPLVQWLALFNRAVFWFHPLAWWLERRLSGLAEEACDDAVLTGGHDPLQYSEYLLGLAREVRQSGARVSAVGMAMPGTYLPERIRRIAAGAQVQRLSRLRMISAGAACSVVSILFMAGAVGYAAPQVLKSPVATVAAEVPTSVEAVQPVADRRKADSIFRKKKATAAPAPVLLAQAVAAPVAASPVAADQSLAGLVTDPSGAVVPNALVTLTNTDAKVTSTTTTDNVGRYKFQNIDVATYSVMIKAPGFKTSTQTGIRVSAGDTHNAGNMPLQLGTISDSVSVVGSRSAPAGPASPLVPSPLGPPTTLGPMTTVPSPGVPQAATFAPRLSMDSSLIRANAGGGGPIRVGGNVQAANLINAVKPVYPPELRLAGIQGTVKFEAVVAKNGDLSDIRLVSPNMDPRLVQVSLDAVKLWKFRPTQLNGEPVETLTTIDVNFSLTD